MPRFGQLLVKIGQLLNRTSGQTGYKRHDCLKVLESFLSRYGFSRDTLYGEAKYVKLYILPFEKLDTLAELNIT